MSDAGRNTRGARRLLMVNTARAGGGAGRVAATLAERLRARGHAVHTFVRGGTRFPDCSPAGHWREIRWAERLGRRGFPELGCPTSLLWCCREEYASADVLHLHNLHGNYVSIAALPLWGRHKPIVWTLHDFWALTGNCAAPRDCTRWRRSCGRCSLVGVYPTSRVDRSRFYRRLKPVLIAAARPLLVTPSRWLAARVRQVPALARLPLCVIPNPIDCDRFRPVADLAAARREFGLDECAPTVVVVGANWADPFKGGRHAVAALRRAAFGVRQLQVLAIGAGADALLAQCRVPGRALPFTRKSDVLARAYACADVCLFPSRAENYPLTTLEAMACGTPVVAYDVGGVPEQIEHGRTGFLAPDGCPDELAEALMAVARGPREARRMGRAARAFVQRRCGVDACVKRYERVYAEALGAWQRRRARRTPRCARGRVARRVARLLGWERESAGEGRCVEDARHEMAAAP